MVVGRMIGDFTLANPPCQGLGLPTNQRPSIPAREVMFFGNICLSGLWRKTKSNSCADGWILVEIFKTGRKWTKEQ